MPFHGQGPGASRKGRPAPPEQTSEEAAYLKSLGEKQKPVSIKLADGEVVRGSIDEGEFSIFYLSDGQVAAALSVGRSDDLEHARRLITSHADVGARAAELGDLGTDLGAI